MMQKGAFLLILLGGTLCAAQTSTAAPLAKAAPEHFRLTFVLSYPDSREAAQSFVVDVPVSSDRPGVADMSSAAGPTGQVEGSAQQSLTFTDVHRSSTGLATKVSFVMHKVSAEPMPGTTEALHTEFRFEKQIDIALAKPTLITEQGNLTALHQEDGRLATARPAAPQITVTATEM